MPGALAAGIGHRYWRSGSRWRGDCDESPAKQLCWRILDAWTCFRRCAWLAIQSCCRILTPRRRISQVESRPEPRAPSNSFAGALADMQSSISDIVRRVVRCEISRADLTQEVNLRILRLRVPLAELQNPLAYLARLVRNVRLDMVRRGRRCLRTGVDVDQVVAHDRAIPSGSCSRSFSEIVAGLTDRERDVLEAWRALGAFKPTATHVGLDVRQVKRCLMRCAHLLRLPRGARESRQSCPPEPS
jgi:DNA-directed RNA polymerase specialized sigma24 family protein